MGGEGWRRRKTGEAGEREDLSVGQVEVEAGEGGGGAVERQSVAARSLCLWVRAMKVYDEVAKVVEPKKAVLAESMAKLQAEQAIVAFLKAQERQSKPFSASLLRYFNVIGADPQVGSGASATRMRRTCDLCASRL